MSTPEERVLEALGETAPSSTEAVWIEDALASLRAQSPPAEASAADGWYCAHCKTGVRPVDVTFEETHTVCGRRITDDKPPAAPPTDADLPPIPLPVERTHTRQGPIPSSQLGEGARMWRGWTAERAARLREREEHAAALKQQHRVAVAEWSEVVNDLKGQVAAADERIASLEAQLAAAREEGARSAEARIAALRQAIRVYGGINEWVHHTLAADDAAQEAAR